ncbi:MAG TPA: hypothetical protein VNK43_03255 [Gemmatimonadales bacterium]|nr:hypothetical protein [Gemmatimonadales bacterium]
MLLSLFVAAISLPAATPRLAPPAPPRGPEPAVEVKVDSARKELVVTAGPFFLPNMPPMEDHAMMDHGESHDTPVHRFEWPVDGWFRGFRIELRDAQGKPLPRHLMHHMIMVNFDRRQLLYPAFERLLGAGQETDDASVPKSIGVPLGPGTRLGMYVAWHNDTGRDLDGVYLKLTLLWTPKNQVPQPLNALPIYMDVNLTVGGSNTYDLPPGRSTKAYEFTLPVGGRLLGVSGHLHDYGTAVRLEDAETGAVLARVKAKRRPDGKVTGIERQLFGVRGDGLKLKANRPYRVVGEYDNTTGQTRIRGAMAHMVGLFVPDDLARWPALDLNDPSIQRDLASLEVRGRAEGDHSGHGEPQRAEHQHDQHQHQE